jgi:hypothetical protein
MLRIMETPGHEWANRKRKEAARQDWPPHRPRHGYWLLLIPAALLVLALLGWWLAAAVP